MEHDQQNSDEKDTSSFQEEDLQNEKLQHNQSKLDRDENRDLL